MQDTLRTRAAPAEPLGGSGNQGRRATVAAMVALAAMVVVVFYDIVFLGRSLTTAAFSLGVGGDPPPLGYPGAAPGGSRFLTDPLASASIFQPAAALAHRLLFTSSSPLWDPSVALGQPLLATAEPQIFNPLRWSTVVAGSPLVDEAFLLARNFGTGAFTFLLGRRLGLGRLGALAAGAAYLFAGYHQLHVNSVHVDYALLVPALLLAVEVFLQRPGALPFAGIAVAAALVTLADNPQAAVIALLLAGGFAVVRSLALRGTTGALGGLLPAAAAVVLGLALTTFAMLPFLELSGVVGFPGESVHTHDTTAAIDGTLALPPPTLITYVLPWLYGAPVAPYPGLVRIDFTNYLGVVVPFLALLGIATRRSQRAFAGFFLAVAVLALAKIFGAPGIQAVGRLPFLEILRFVLYLPPALNLSCAVLAGVGVDELAHRRLGPRHLAAAVAVTLAGGSALVWANRGLLGPIPDGVAVAVIGLGAVLLVVTVLVVAAAGLPRVPPAAAPLALSGLILVEAFLLSAPARGDLGAITATGEDLPERPQRHDPYAVPPSLAALPVGTEPFRVVGQDVALFPNSAQGVGLQDLRGQTTLTLARYLALVQRYLDPVNATQRFAGYGWSPFTTGGTPQERAKAALLDLLNVRYFLVAGGATPSVTTGDKLVSQGAPSVYENSGVLPRAFLVPAVLPAGDRDEALDRMDAVLADPGGLAVVEGLPAEQLGALDQPGGGGGATVTDYQPAALRVAVDARAPSLLVVSDAYYPGWTAQVDGRPATVHPTDVALRGVFVETGAHEVVLRFRSPTVRAGGLVTLVALAALAGCVALGLARAAGVGRRSTAAGPRRSR